MLQDNPRSKLAILRALRETTGPIGSGTIAGILNEHGIDVRARTLRLYLEQLEKEGLVTPSGRGRNGGRRITRLGLQEIDQAGVTERVGLLASRVNALIHRMSFDAAFEKGTVILNVSVVSDCDLRQAVREMGDFFRAGLGVGQYLTLFASGERVGDVRIPPGHTGIGTLCSMTLNGLLLSRRIPVASKFAGVLEIKNGAPFRFTDVVYYDGTSLDPLTIFIKSGLLSVRSALSTGAGSIGASLREIPACARSAAESVFSMCASKGLGHALLIGRPGHPLLSMPVQDGCLGLVFAGGLNSLALVEEAGMPTENHGTVCLFPFEKLRHYNDLARDLGVGFSDSDSGTGLYSS